MNSEPRAHDREWRLWPPLIISLFVATAAVLGFLILPVVQGSAGVGAFAAICRAVGIQPGSPAKQQPSSKAQAQPVSGVAWTTEVIDGLHRPNPQTGKELATAICAGCHGENGVSPDPQYPNMAGQSAFAIYKQLHDFKSGARSNELIAQIVQQLDDRQMVDVAAHFAALPKGALDAQTVAADDPQIVTLVERGDSLRGLPPCAACRGTRAGGAH